MRKPCDGPMTRARAIRDIEARVREEKRLEDATVEEGGAGDVVITHKSTSKRERLIYPDYVSGKARRLFAEAIKKNL
jgi:hypothetical protein